MTLQLKDVDKYMSIFTRVCNDESKTRAKLSHYESQKAIHGDCKDGINYKLKVNKYCKQLQMKQKNRKKLIGSYTKITAWQIYLDAERWNNPTKKINYLQLGISKWPRVDIKLSEEKLRNVGIDFL